MGKAEVVALCGSEGFLFSLKLEKSSISGVRYFSSGNTLLQWKYTAPVALYFHWRSTKGLTNQAVNKKDGGGRGRCVE